MSRGADDVAISAAASPAQRRVAVVTGATGGIGRAVALGLARAGLQTVLIGRDASRLEATARAIQADALVARATSPAPRTVLADLSLLADTGRAAAQVLASFPVLDVLVNNAGVLVPRRTDTAEGHELTLAVNHLSPFLLTRCLLPALRASGRGRVVQTGSSTADRAQIDPDDLPLRRGWRMTRAYARSKLALQMTAVALAAAERAHPDGTPAGEQGGTVCINVVHPGLVATGLVRSGGIDQLVWRHVLRHLALSPERGADTILHAALSPALAGISGCYLSRREAVRPNRRVLDPALRARVLAATERLVGAD